VRWLAQQGLQAGAFATEYGDQDDDPAGGPEPVPASDSTPANAAP